MMLNIKENVSLSRENVLVGPGTAISISIRFSCLFDIRFAPHASLYRDSNLNTLHDLLSMVSVRPSVSNLFV